jgi:protein subunit release factor B
MRRMGGQHVNSTTLSVRVPHELYDAVIDIASYRSTPYGPMLREVIMQWVAEIEEEEVR